MRKDVQRAIAARDAAFARIRLVTGVAVAAGVALTGAFAALAAGATHLRKTVVTTTHVAPRPKPAKHTQAPVSAPAPPLVSAGGSASETPPPAAPSTSYSAPTPTPAPPVVVSGGS